MELPLPDQTLDPHVQMRLDRVAECDQLVKLIHIRAHLVSGMNLLLLEPKRVK